MKRSELLAFLEAFKLMRDNADDKLASSSAEVFPKLKNNSQLIKAGTKINFNGTLKRARVDLWDTETNNPDNAPTLWEDLAYKAGYRVLTSQITAENTVALNELCWYNNKLYRSLIANNVWLPDAYPAGWEEVTNG